MPPVIEETTEATTTKTSGNGKNKSGARKKSKERSIEYPEIGVEKYVGDDALVVDGPGGAKEMLGWEIVDRNDPNKDDYLLIDYMGNRIRCTNNCKNRPFMQSHAEKLAQDILNRNWRMNCENIIIGKTKLVLSGQHRLVGLVLAKQLWEGYDPNAKKAGTINPDLTAHWTHPKLWPTEPVLETLIAFGAEESDDYLQTLDNVMPRSFSDILFTQSSFMQSLKDDNGKVVRKLDSHERINIARMADAAIHVLWKRTGASKDQFCPFLSHSQALDFLAAHPTLIKCLEHVYEEDRSKKRGDAKEKTGNFIHEMIGRGTAAAMMYLMATCDTNGHTYRTTEGGPREGTAKKPYVNFAHFEQAREFWTEFALGSTNKSFKPLFEALSKHTDPDQGWASSKLNTNAILCKAWKVYVDGQNFTDKRVSLSDDERYQHEKSGLFLPRGNPTMGGIDVGDPNVWAADETEAREKREAEEAAENEKAELNTKMDEEDEEWNADKSNGSSVRSGGPNDADDVKPKKNGKASKKKGKKYAEPAAETDEPEEPVAEEENVTTPVDDEPEESEEPTDEEPAKEEVDF